jgi:hypothetical protein
MLAGNGEKRTKRLMKKVPLFLLVNQKTKGDEELKRRRYLGLKSGVQNE